jgi:F0F1-type ATP synthase assembly protein I
MNKKQKVLIIIAVLWMVIGTCLAIEDNSRGDIFLLGSFASTLGSTVAPPAILLLGIAWILHKKKE